MDAKNQCIGMCRQCADAGTGSSFANQRASAVDENNRTGETPVKSSFGDRRGISDNVR